MQDYLNKIVMEEIGLGVDSYQKVIDQDSRDQLKFKDKNIKYSSQNSVVTTKNDIIFDPAENKNLMCSLFDHFTQKIESEENKYVSMYYDISDNTGYAIAAMVDGIRVTSDHYNNESLKYIDIIMKINGTEDVDLKKYDNLIIKNNKKRK